MEVTYRNLSGMHTLIAHIIDTLSVDTATEEILRDPLKLMGAALSAALDKEKSKKIIGPLVNALSKVKFSIDSVSGYRRALESNAEDLLS